MSVSTAQEQLLTSAYSMLRSSGVLRTSLGRRFFRSAYFFYKQYIEDHLQDLLRSHPALVRGGNLLDIGANIGYTSSVLARAADPGRKVYAFEPEPFNYSLLQQMASRPEFKEKIVARQCAVGAEDGFVDLWLNDRHHADHRVITSEFRSENPGMSSTRVPLLSIDGILERSPDPISFVKIDVQGYELPVCQGMVRTIEKNAGITVVLEYSPSAMRVLGFEPTDLVSFLTDRGFQAYFIRSNGELRRGIPTGIEKSGYVDLLLSRRDIACEAER